jgi:lipoyl(octanoyl) transferase
VDEVWTVRAGRIPYEEARVVQKRLEEARLAGEVADLLLLLEHPPVYTRGRRSTPDELPMGEDWYRRQGIEVADTDRGGRVTYHGPGQLVAYPILSLKPYGDDVHDYIRRVEQVIIAALRDWHVEARLITGLTGVWTDDRPSGVTTRPATGLRIDEPQRKIASIGVHVNRGVTTHGFAVNVNNDLQPFEWVVPCGIESCRMTSVARELGAEQDLDAFAIAVSNRFGEIYSRAPVEVSPAELAESVPGLEALAGMAASVR